PITVHLGGHGHLKVPPGQIPKEQRVKSSKIFPFPGYNESSKDGDLMLLKLQVTAQVGPQVTPLPLATTCPVPGTSCQISGWGSITSPQGQHTPG
ncbi:PREDICTED: kallikrein-14-like, partial [Acanthisitta chloris]|uniref:kallikrein-14-like n=1 Tax=Acanthisitta chloris TaxID=57068 RepID=UPI0004F0F71F